MLMRPGTREQAAAKAARCVSSAGCSMCKDRELEAAEEEAAAGSAGTDPAALLSLAPEAPLAREEEEEEEEERWACAL
jgi:hypothetical protein